MHREYPSQFQGQYEQQRSRSTEGSQQFEGGSWEQGQQRRTQPAERQQQPRQAPQEQPRRQQPQQFGAAGAATQQSPRETQQTRQQTQQSPQQFQGGTYAQQPSTQQGMGGQQWAGERPGGMQAQQRMAQQGMQQPQGAQEAAGFPATRGTQLQAITLEEIARSEVVTVAPDDRIEDVVVQMADKDVGSVVVAEDGRPMGVLTDRKIALKLGEVRDLPNRTAGDLVSGDLVTATPDTTVYEAVQTLRDEGIRRLPIVDREGTLEGIVTLDDVIVLIAGELGAAAEVIERQAPPR